MTCARAATLVTGLVAGVLLTGCTSGDDGTPPPVPTQTTPAPSPSSTAPSGTTTLPPGATLPETLSPSPSLGLPIPIPTNPEN